MWIRTLFAKISNQKRISIKYIIRYSPTAERWWGWTVHRFADEFVLADRLLRSTETRSVTKQIPRRLFFIRGSGSRTSLHIITLTHWKIIKRPLFTSCYLCVFRLLHEQLFRSKFKRVQRIIKSSTHSWTRKIFKYANVTWIIYLNFVLISNYLMLDDAIN